MGARKIVINACHGGFSLSHKAALAYAKAYGYELTWEREGGPYYTEVDGKREFFDADDADRDDPNLVKIVENLGEEASGMCAQLEIVEIPDDVEWHIAEYDGLEWVAENHRTWS